MIFLDTQVYNVICVSYDVIFLFCFVFVYLSYCDLLVLIVSEMVQQLEKRMLNMYVIKPKPHLMIYAQTKV